MTPESSPFSPGQPVPIEFFVGRLPEIERLRGMVHASTRGRFKIGFVSGERGIGKSSLAAFARRSVEGDFDVAGCHVFLGGVQDHREMLRRTLDRILNESVDKPWHRQLMDLFGDRVSKVGLFGVTLELNLDERDLVAVERDFAASMRRLLESLGEHRKSLFLILDDINGLAGSEGFANWLKSTVDEIATSEAELRLCILVVGLQERRRELVERQPSLARVFELIDIAPWSDDEVCTFYADSFGAGGAAVSEEGLEILVRSTGGLPVLAHEIGDAVWRTARGPAISLVETVEGIYTAAEVIGRKLLDPQVFSAIRSERYHSIFGKMADLPGTRFGRAQLRESLTDAEAKGLDNFLRRMTALGALERDPETRGTYRFPNLLHALYFRMESQRRRREEGA
ncbi:MAG: ATP-binding protein [Gemmatimonadaceae bacterium]|nr:ATP-binding protein [Gemmatimonadaceae bacterium]